MVREGPLQLFPHYHPYAPVEEECYLRCVESIVALMVWPNCAILWCAYSLGRGMPTQVWCLSYAGCFSCDNRVLLYHGRVSSKLENAAYVRIRARLGTTAHKSEHYPQ